MKKNNTIITSNYCDEMSSSYLDYSISVITDRAIPDVRDGLKPVHRRILYGMKELNLKYSLPYKKSARIVGEVMGKYHPHGDASIYDAMAHMAQEWCYLHPLVDGHGNFGSIEGDEQAASRYTEARLSKIAENLFLQDLDKNIVNFVPNFDDNEKEPIVLPVKVPNLLLSGTEGIAVGMISKIPTHNLGELIDGTIAVMEKPKITNREIFKYIKGPDFSTGGTIANSNELLDIYEKGFGKIRIRGNYKIDKTTNGKQNIVISEIPYTMIGSIDKFLDTIATLINNRELPDVSDVKNFSGKDGIKIVIELKKEANINNVINILYKKAKLEDIYTYNAMALCDGTPRQLSLKEMLNEFIVFNNQNYKKKYQYLLEKEKTQKEIKEGLLKAVECIDLIIEILRGSTKISDARDCLRFGKIDNILFKTKSFVSKAKKLSFSETQTNAILEMKMQRLIGLEVFSLQKELTTCIENIEEYSSLLNSPTKLKNKIKKDLLLIKKEYAIPRRTQLSNVEEITIEKNTISEENMHISIDKFGYIKAVDDITYERNKELFIGSAKHFIEMKNTDKICIFTNTGKCHFIKGFDIPFCKFKDKGIMLNNISNFVSTENILFISSVSNIIDKKILFVNENGMAKVVLGDEFVANKRTIDSTKKDSGELIFISPIFSETDIAIKTQNRYFIRFKLNEITIMKKASIGVKTIKLKENDVINTVKIGNGKTKIDNILFSSIKLTKRDSVGTKKS